MFATLLALALALSSRARAADLQVHAPDDCATAAAIGLQVEGLIGRPLAQVEHVDFAVEISQRSAGDYMLSLRTERDDASEPRTRQLLGASCDEVSDAAAVAIAMTITGANSAPASESAATTPAAPPPAAKPAAPAPMPAPSNAATAVAPRNPWWSAAGVYALIDGGVLPAIAPGAQLELTVGWHSLSLRVSGAVFASQEARLADDSGGADFELLLAGALVCGERAFAALHALACAGGELGSLSGHGNDLTVPLDRATLFSAVRAEAGLGYALEPGLSLLLRGGVSVPLTRRDFEVNNGRSIHRAASVSARAALGLQLEL